MNRETLIEKYLQDTLSEKEREAFTQLLQTDSSFKKEVEFEQSLSKVIENEEDTAFKKQLATFEKNNPQKKRSYTTWLVAASIALILGVTYVQFNSQPSAEELFAENFAPFTNVIQPVVRGNTADDIVTKAFVAYEKKEYPVAENLFFKIFRTQKKQYALFYAAMSQLAQGKTKEAKTMLKLYLKYPNGSFTTQAHWYMALAHIKESNTNAAKDELQIIIDANGDFKTQATQLLKKLE